MQQVMSVVSPQLEQKFFFIAVLEKPRNTIQMDGGHPFYVKALASAFGDAADVQRARGL